MPANRLLREQSPYLIQHAHNPVDWFPWGKEAFDKARKEQKIVLLSIGYSTCHWCHVMAHESFEDETIAAFLNENFVSIKVDREERPDIDHIYMTAVTSMTGQGGWPLTVFLTPDGKPFYGGTYFPPYAKWGAPGFMDLLHSVASAWHQDRLGITNSAEEITDVLRQASKGSPQNNSPLNPDILDTAARQMLGQMDEEHGGFGNAPKFPMGHNLSFLLRYYKRTKDNKALELVEKTLTTMVHGGIWDHLGGGFHRYATDRLWHVPHFEKMLYDQSMLVTAYVEAYQITGNLLYAQTAEEVLEYVLRDMTSPEGVFYSAEDADSVEAPGQKAKEGAFYVWSYNEIKDLLGVDADLFNRVYGVEVGGNVKADPHGEFVGKNILSVVNLPSVGQEDILARARQKLFEQRCQRIRPGLDDKVLTDWNGLMIGAFAFAGVVLGEQRYIDAAKKAADFILIHMKTKEGLLHRWRKGEAAIDGMLEDYAFLLLGLISLYEASFDAKYLKEAENLAETMTKVFADTECGGFFMTKALEHSEGGLILRPQDVYDGALPSGNSVAAFALMKLHYLSGQDEFKKQAESTFNRFMSSIARAPHAYAFFLSAFELYTQPVTEISVHGPADQATIALLRKVVYKQFMPSKVFKYQEGKGGWFVSVCRQGTCLPPVKDLASLEKLLD
jgi:uncharacterized protein